MIKKILSSLRPREDKFYRLLEQLATQARICALHLRTFVETADLSQREAAGKAIMACRVESKKLSAAVTQELCHTFITPFDREDIQDFSISLYKITKTIEKIRERIALHGLSSDGGDFSRQIELIVLESEAMEDMVRELTHGHDSNRIVEKVAVLHDLENCGDSVLSELLSSLFSANREARDLILRKDIYDMLEKVIDRYRDAAGVALQIVLKHS